MGRVLCWLGLHKWAYIGASEFFGAGGVWLCTRHYHVCERCRAERVRES